MTTRPLIPLCLALMLGAAPLFAQTAQPPPQEPPAAPANGAEQNTPAPQPSKTQADAAKKSSDDGASKESPFDYSASEQISEDLPVSFPVDI